MVNWPADINSGCYSLGNKHSAEWYYDDAKPGPATISVHYAGDNRTAQVDMVCDETATTPVYTVNKEDPPQPYWPVNYKLQLTSMYACKVHTGPRSCKAPPPPPPPQQSCTYEGKDYSPLTNPAYDYSIQSSSSCIPYTFNVCRHVVSMVEECKIIMQIMTFCISSGFVGHS